MQENPSFSPLWCSVNMDTFSIALGIVADNVLFDFFISFLSFIFRFFNLLLPTPGGSAKFCRENMLHSPTLGRIHDLRKQLSRILNRCESGENGDSKPRRGKRKGWKRIEGSQDKHVNVFCLLVF